MARPETPISLSDAFAAFFASPVEWIGAVLSALSIWLLARQRVWGWPIGLVATALYVPVYFAAHLFADMALYALVYLPGQVYGWIVWTRRPAGSVLTVRRGGAGPVALLLGAAALGTAGLGWGLSRIPTQSLPYWDAFTTAFAIAGQLMQARKWLENWLLWIVVDAVAAGVYVVKGLYPTALLYAFFIVLAWRGYVGWRRDLAGQPALAR